MKFKLLFVLMILTLLLTSCDDSDKRTQLGIATLEYNTLTMTINHDLKEDAFVKINFEVKTSELDSVDFGNYYTLDSSNSFTDVVVEDLDYGTEYTVNIIEVPGLDEEASMDELIDTFDIFIGVTASDIDDNLLDEYTTLINNLELYENYTRLSETYYGSGIDEITNFYHNSQFVRTNNIVHITLTNFINNSYSSIYFELYHEFIENDVNTFVKITDMDWIYSFQENYTLDEPEEVTYGTEFDFLSIVDLEKEVIGDSIQYTVTIDSEGLNTAFIRFVETKSGDWEESITGMSAEAVITVENGQIIQISVDMIEATNYFYNQAFEGSVERYDVIYTYTNIGTEPLIVIPAEIAALKE